MGWVYGFHSLDPRVIKELASASRDDLVARLMAHGVVLDPTGGESWDDDYDDNTALTILATTRKWDVDKQWDRVSAIAALEPSLEPVNKLLREMEDFSASSLAERFHPAEVGLMGLAMSETIAVALAAAEPFAGEDGRAALGRQSSWLQRLVPGGVRKQIASDDLLWRRWNDLIEAMRWSHSRGEWLGLHMA